MRKKKKRWRRSMMLFLCVSFLAIAGCQNGGYELQKALLSGFDSYSYQSKEYVTLQLDLNEQALAKLPKDEQQFYRTFQEVTFALIDHIEVGRDKESNVGVFEFIGGEIPFIHTRNGNETVLYVEGAKQPIVFNDDARFKLEQIEVTEEEIGPAPAGVSKDKKAEWSPQFSLIYSGVAMPSGIVTNGWLPSGTMKFKSSEYDQWRSKRIDEIRAQKVSALRAKGQLAKPGYGGWIVDLKNTLEQAKGSLRDLSFYTLRNTPLPRTAMLDNVVMEINGKEEELKRLTIQVEGSVFGEMLAGMLQNFANNTSDLRAFIEGIYDLATIYNKSRLEQLREIDPDGEEMAALQQYLGDREGMVDALYEEFLAIIEESLTAAEEEVDEVEDDSSAFDQAALGFEFYYQFTTGRAANMHVYIPLSASEESPLKGITISYVMLRWNVGEELPLQTINLSGGKLDYFQKDSGYPFSSPYELLQFFDASSDAYRLLEAINVTGVDVDFPVAQGTLQEGERSGAKGSRAYIENGVTLVPVRFVSEQLYADVKWNGDKREVVITDAASGKVIVLVIGSKTAWVDGKPVTLQVAPMISPSGKTYVPIRFIAETLGAEVKWNGEQRRVGVKK